MLCRGTHGDGTDQTAEDALNSAVRNRLLATGAAVIGETRFDGRPVLKLTLMNPLVSDAELHTLLETIERCAQELSQAPA